MEKLPAFIFSAILLISAVAWMLRHILVWRQMQQQSLDPRDFDFHRRQFQRRMQTSAMLGVLAVALFVGIFLHRPPWLVLAYWGGVLLLVMWTCLLAAVDGFAARMHYARLRDRVIVDRARLQERLRQRLEPDKPESDLPESDA